MQVQFISCKAFNIQSFDFIHPTKAKLALNFNLVSKLDDPYTLNHPPRYQLIYTVGKVAIFQYTPSISISLYRLRES